MQEEQRKGIYQVFWLGCGKPFNLPYPWGHSYHNHDGDHCVAIVPATDQHEAWAIVKRGYAVKDPDVMLERVVRQSPNFTLEDFRDKGWAPAWPAEEGHPAPTSINDIAERVAASLFFVKEQMPVPDTRIVFEDITAGELRRMVEFVRAFAKA